MSTANTPIPWQPTTLVWSATAVFAFWDLYKGNTILSFGTSLYVLVAAACVGAALYFFYIFPLFPPIEWAAGWKPPSELLYASAWYFLPKSIEIVLQQLLIAAMVLKFNAQKFSLPVIARWSALLFGGMHLLLVFGGSSPLHVWVFTLSAVVAGFIFPYLMLRVRNGYLYSYLLHWGFYAIVIVLARVISAT